MDPRVLLTEYEFHRAFTVVHDDRTFEGDWSRPNVPLLIFANHTFPALFEAVAGFHGGPIGTGLPVQLVFWGEWWKSSEGTAQRQLVVERTQSLLASNYFSELAQYGIQQPTYRGAIIATLPAPPTSIDTEDDSEEVYDLIHDLIDDDVFPEPDEERIAYMVMLPKDVPVSIESGGHAYETDYDFPLDIERYWVAWARYYLAASGEDAEYPMVILSHELVELFTDPEQDGWFMHSPIDEEIADGAISPGGVLQTAFVNGVRVQAYWSNRHKANVIPIDGDYSARLTATVTEKMRDVLEEGTFRPDPTDSAACSKVRECCIEDRDYRWRLYLFGETAKVRMFTHRYRMPKAEWSIEGKPVSGNGVEKFTLPVGAFVDGRRPVSLDMEVSITYYCSDDSLEIQSRNLGNFDLHVSCKVRDASITGNLQTDVIATPSIVIGFVNLKVELDPEYTDKRADCFKALTALYNQHYQGPQRIPGRGDPIDQSILVMLPAYARLDQFRQAREALRLSQMANVLLPEEDAQAYARSLVKDIPALSMALDLAARKRSGGGP